MAAVRHLGFIWGTFGPLTDHHRRVLSGVYHYAKFGCDRCNSFDHMNVSLFGAFGWKKPIHALKIGVWGYLIP